jgi:hypothetical protein
MNTINTDNIIHSYSPFQDSAVKLVHFPSMTVFSNFPGGFNMNRVNSLGWSPATGYLSLGRSYSSPGVSYLFRWVVFSAVLRIHDILA